MLESRKKVDIPLKHIANTQQRGNIAALGRAVCENEYATRYLEGIGVQATKDQRDTVLANMPIEVCNCVYVCVYVCCTALY